MTETTRVLFLCTGNSARSLMSEALLRDMASDRFEAHSAGREPFGVRPETLEVLAEAGVSVDGLRSKGIDEYLGKVQIGILITVCAHAEENCPRIWPGVSTHLHWPIEDPALVEGEGRIEAFRRARDEITARMQEWLAEMDAASE